MRNRQAVRILSLAMLAAACGGSDGGSPEIFYEGYESAIYSDDAHWMCKKGLANDVCDQSLDATVVAPDGTLTLEPHVPASDPDFDCFYVYPTVRLGTEGNAPFDGNYDEEIYTTRAQAARFGRHCEVYAPLYRQRTLTATGSNNGEIAYADVLDAFRYYLGNLNEGRPFVLIGHSQGAGHLRRLVAEEIDGDPGVRDRMISAILLGTTVEVPEGADVGGSFDNVPACRSSDQFGCVISYASYRSTVPPPPSSLFGRARPGMQALCTNPASLSGGAGPLVPYFNIVDDSQFSPANPRLAWDDDVVDPPAIATPFVALPGMITAECAVAGGASYLELTPVGDPGPRADDFGGDLTPEWGLHLLDASAALGNLVEIAAAEAAAWHEAH
ncbi:MAG: DUF3089 domain-containing protein [Deltaproteobacteria bacterium]|nr:DUF3089 domain-containing protein [Deltaproteobacteria bacterium]